MNAPSALDQTTTLAIRSAISAASAGHLQEARAIAERALNKGGDQVALNALLGMLLCKLEDFDAALRHLRPAREARPGDISIATNLLLALVECGRHEEAFALASPELAKADPTQTIARYRGYVAQLLGDAATARKTYEDIVATAPADWQSWNNLGNARLLEGDIESAIIAFRKSLSLNQGSPEIWLNLARALVRVGEFEEAEVQLRTAADCFPADVQPLRELYELLRRMDRPDDILRDVLERAVERAPGDKDLLLELSGYRMLALDKKGAEQACRSVLAAHPHDADAWLDLANLYEHSSPEQLPALLAEIEEAKVPSPVPEVAHAFVHRRAKAFKEGLDAIEVVPGDFKPWMVEELRGHFLDKLGDFDGAFAAFTRMNEAAAADPSDPLARAQRYRSVWKRRLELLSADWLASGDRSPPSPNTRSPVFLVGFPRSGTTLLDTMLMGHPDVDVLEEKPLLEQVSRGLGGFEALPELDQQRAQKARLDYFELAAKAGAHDPRKVLVDKNPFHMMQVPLIHRLFPDAQFILALRHPADVVLSCFFSNFRAAPALSSFLRLDTAAELYDLAFSVWEKSRGLLPVKVHPIVYERLVEDPEAQLRPLIEALGLEWRASLLNHADTAASRDLIATASYAQVTEPLYRSSAGRWQNYRPHLEPVFPVLKPWAEKLGYSI